MKSVEGGVRLELYNFDLPQHQDCPYILTSPRSLEACRRLSIKPVELLQRSRDDYDAAHPGQPLPERLVAYHAQERLRLTEDGRGASCTPQGQTAAPGPSHGKEREPKKVDRNKEEEKEEGKEESQEEEEEGTSLGPSLVRQDSDASSYSSVSSKVSKRLKDQENLARSLISRQPSTGGWEAEDGVTGAGNRRGAEEEEKDEYKTLKNKDDEHAGDDEEQDDKINHKENETAELSGDSETTLGAVTEAVETECQFVTTPGVSGHRTYTVRTTGHHTFTPSTRDHKVSAPSVTRKPKTGVPRPSSAQRVKQGDLYRSGLTHAPKRATQQQRVDTKSSPAFTRVPGEPYRASVAGSSKTTTGKLARPSSATVAAPQHKQQQPRAPLSHTTLPAFKAFATSWIVHT
ncbi:uncharacterized protein [Procambarus clarkii]|uniref:uncharacterized protein n=1 Tax=Procambarus clarkii TaxID=6728 RepID=UPI0037433BB2